MTSKKLDQFYTKTHIAKICYNMLDNFLSENNISKTCFLEPSAGSGAFFNLLPKDHRIGIDIDPKFDEIINYDFLRYNLIQNDFITIGNPPFGKNSSLAIKFFNKCAQHSKIIAFIVPKTFKKISVINRLDQLFHLKYQFDIPKFSFEFDSVDYDVPCVFQIWVKQDDVREIIKPITIHNDFVFTSKNNADFAIQRVGVNAGKVKEDFINCAVSSHYFIKSDTNLIDIFKKINWDDVKYNTAGNPSISKSEIIELYNKLKSESEQ